VKRIVLFLLLAVCFGYGAENSFDRIRVPDAKGKLINATITFSDKTQAIVIRPIKGNVVTIPYAEIDRLAYEYTKRHRVSGGSIATAPIGIGAVVMLTKAKSHWLEMDYQEDNIRKTYVIHMDKHDYLRILEAFKTHTGKDAEILGNANKR
jgi:hypothetical protein